MPSHDAMTTAQHQTVELRSMSLPDGRNDQDTDDAEDRPAAGLAGEYFGSRYAKMSTEDQGYLKELNRRTLKKLDTVLLPFLALLFLFNSLDRSNVSIKFLLVTAAARSSSNLQSRTFSEVGSD
jgi:hypothetical protein